jgi:4-hydroxyphenylpyruvate dioxygenase-like putative hemolysin
LQEEPDVLLLDNRAAGVAGFGVGNFKALFGAIEIEQARRGNL